MTDAEIDALVPLPQPGINTASHSHLRVVGYPAEQVLAHTRAAVRAALSARLGEPVQPVARWYVLSPDGMACLCADQVDAVAQAADADRLFPRHGPHQAVQMAPIAAHAAAPTVQPVAVPEGVSRCLRPMLTHAQVREAAQAELATWEQSAPGGPTAYEVTHSICRRLGVELEPPKGGA